MRCCGRVAESRFEALHAGGLTALVGREEEIELLLRRWAEAKAGEGQAVLISGEAGIGKSRLTAACWSALRASRIAPALFLLAAAHRQRVLSDHRSLERAAGFAREDEAKTRLDKLDALLAQVRDLARGRRALCRDAVAAE